MDSLTESLSVYRDLADRYDQLGQLSMRDRFLMLAASAALEAGNADEADRLRQRLLQTSRHHMLRPYTSFAEAYEAPDVQTYLKDLHENYPLETARELLGSLQGSEAAVNLDRTQPIPLTGGNALPSTIPPTAPVVDPHAARPSGQRPIWQPAQPYPVANELDKTQIPAGARPAAQPVGQTASPAGRSIPLNVPSGKPVSIPLNPTAELPAARTPANAPRADTSTSRAVPVVNPASGGQTQAQSTATGQPAEVGSNAGWVNVTLAGIVILAALALTGFTLARPFLPAEWLP